jgi:hypothetical protein
MRPKATDITDYTHRLDTRYPQIPLRRGARPRALAAPLEPSPTLRSVVVAILGVGVVAPRRADNACDVLQE